MTYFNRMRTTHRVSISVCLIALSVAFLLQYSLKLRVGRSVKKIWELRAEGNPRMEYVHGELDNSVSQIQPAKRLFDKGRKKTEGELEIIQC